MTEAWFPLSADIRNVLIVFAVLLILFDLILVRWIKLNKISWKRVEYIWLGFAALGLFGAVSQVRISVAQSQISDFNQRSLVAFESLRHLTDLLSSRPGAVCRTFVHSQYSPPPEEFDRSQKEYDDVCGWLKLVGAKIPANIPSPAAEITPDTLPSRPNASSADLKDILNGYYKQLGYYNNAVKVVKKLEKETKRNATEDMLVLLGPYFLSIALALRITKVTGEIKLDS